MGIMIMDEVQGRFLTLLKQEETILDELHELLQKEMNALKAHDTELIYELVNSKNSLLDKLGMLDKQRQLYVENERNLLLADNTFTNQINFLSEEIKSSLDKCKHQNKINGGIIEMSQLFNKKMLDIVCGNSDKEATYSAEGKNNSGNNQHSIAHV